MSDLIIVPKRDELIDLCKKNLTLRKQSLAAQIELLGQQAALLQAEIRENDQLLQKLEKSESNIILTGV